MSPTLTSQGLVLATAMAVSAATAVLFDLLRDKYFPQFPPNHNHQQPAPLKSCLLISSPSSSSGSKKSEKKSKKKKKKRVRFAEDVKDPKGNGESYRRRERKSDQVQKNSCGNEFQKIPANHAALYNGIIKGRVHKMGYSY